jgi:hypothetical protein
MTGDYKKIWEDLVLAILSVNQYSLENTYSKIKGMRQEGLCEPENLAGWTPPEINLRLKRAGLDRGQFMTKLFAERLSSLGQYLNSVGIEHCQRILAQGAPSAIKRLLLPVKGIGPKVLARFFLLEEIEDNN